MPTALIPNLQERISLSENPSDERANERSEFKKCPKCGRWMLTTKEMKNMSKECFEKLNKAGDLKEEEARWKREKEAWAEEERKLWNGGGLSR